MQLTNPSILEVSVDPEAYLKAAASKEGLWYLLDRLFSGERIAEEELRTWGLSVKLVDEFVSVRREG